MSRSPEITPSEPPKAKSLGPLLMIWRAALNYPGRVVIAFLALVTTAAAMLAIPAGFKLVIDEGFTNGGDPDEIARWFRYLGLIVVVLALGTATRFYFVSWLGERVVADIRKAVQDNLLRLSPGFFEENSPREISSRMTADTTLIEQVVGTTVSVALRNVLMAIGGTIYLYWLAPSLTIGLVIAIPLVVLPIVIFARRVRSVSRTSQDRVADIGSMVSEVLGSMKVVQAFGQQEREQGRFAAAVERVFDTAKRRILLRAIMTSLIIFFIFGSITVLMWRGAVGVSTGAVSGGTIFAFVLTGGLVAGAFAALTEVYGDLLRGAGAASRLNELLREEPGIATPARPIDLAVELVLRRLRRAIFGANRLADLPRGRFQLAVDCRGVRLQPIDCRVIVEIAIARGLQFAQQFGAPRHQRLDGGIVEHWLRGEQRRPLNGFPPRLRGNTVCTRGNRSIVELDEAGRRYRPGQPVSPIRCERVIGPDETGALGIIIEFSFRFFEIDARFLELLGHEVARI